MSHLATNACALPQPGACAIPESGTRAITSPVPLRWEWRTFDYQPERWTRLLHRVELLPSPEPVEEYYLLTPQSPDNVKLRHGRVVVKRLLRTSPAGLELWQPALEAELPLDSATVMALCDAWRVERPEIAPSIATAEALFAWVARALPEVRIVPVRKLRRRFRLLHCEGEWITLEAGAAKLESLALEHHDPAVIQAAMVELRLNGAPNVNYVDGLKRFLGWQVDVGHCVPALPV